MSWVIWSPPRGITAESVSVPRRKTPTSVVPPPMSIKHGSEFAFAVGQDCQTRSEGLYNHAIDFDTRVLSTAPQVLQRALRSGDDMDVNF